MYVSESEMQRCSVPAVTPPLEEIRADEIEAEVPALEVPPMPEPPPPSFSDMAPPPSPFSQISDPIDAPAYRAAECF